MELPKFSTRYNAMTITSIRSFAGIKGGFNHECKDVYFVRCIGCGRSYTEEIQDMDRQLAIREMQQQGKYIRIGEFPRLAEPEDTALYSQVFDEWERSRREEIVLKPGKQSGAVRTSLSQAANKALSEFRRCSPNASQSMERNFVIKLLFWADRVAGCFFDGWSEKNTDKFVCSGNIRKQEYLFCYFLTLLGIDVLILLPGGEADVCEGLKKLSLPLNLGETGQVSIPPYDADVYRRTPPDGSLSNRRTTPRRARERAPQNPPPNAPAADRSVNREMPFEELARLASSVVMITVHDREGRVVSTGSGIMVGKDGYILTNNHVADGGRFYSVRIEEDEDLYETDEVIKYNQMLDLAVIRIDRALKPIPVYDEKRPLVRGQKVVAIGSPLGLFNSVSDGIISGFRKINDVDMIQFTAPISHGSSGGAVLNMYGEVIGISTAGFDEGQNINLAVNFRCITDFIRGFV